MKVRLQGGLGNQLFQYSFGRSLSLVRNEELFFDKTLIEADPQRSYSLGAYGLMLNFDPSVHGPLFVENGMPYDPRVLTTPKGTVFHGYWQSEKYFNIPVIRKEFSRPAYEPSNATLDMAAWITEHKNTCFVSVRRGDYIRLNVALPLEYYIHGMRMIEANYPDTHFFIFSDDEPWCVDNFKETNCTVVRSGRKDSKTECGTVHWDLWLMSLCRNAVLANSTFSWWGAWLNPREDRTVIASKKTFPGCDIRDLFPEKWMVV